MTKRIYDFSKAEKELRQSFSPAELSENLKVAALRCAVPDSGTREEMILQMQLAVLDVCAVIDKIIVKEVEV